VTAPRPHPKHLTQAPPQAAARPAQQTIRHAVSNQAVPQTIDHHAHHCPTSQEQATVDHHKHDHHSDQHKSMLSYPHPQKYSGYPPMEATAHQHRFLRTASKRAGCFSCASSSNRFRSAIYGRWTRFLLRHSKRCAAVCAASGRSGQSRRHRPIMAPNRRRSVLDCAERRGKVTEHRPGAARGKRFWPVLALVGRSRRLFWLGATPQNSVFAGHRLAERARKGACFGVQQRPASMAGVRIYAVQRRLSAVCQ